MLRITVELLPSGRDAGAVVISRGALPLSNLAAMAKAIGGVNGRAICLMESRPLPSFICALCQRIDAVQHNSCRSAIIFVVEQNSIPDCSIAGL